jgi:uncharacterized membrane protein YfcA
MEFVVIPLAAFCASLLTLYSGFGLGTLLMPVFALFFPVEVAVGATAVVHAMNNVAKAALLGKLADRSLVARFGLPALAGSFAGAGALSMMAETPPLLAYTLGPHVATITPLKLVMGVLILVFALFELIPPLRRWQVQQQHLVVGGLLSGFFGGLSGHQGALRSAFLVRAGGTPESFVGTNAMIALMVDAARLLVYGSAFLLGSGRGRSRASSGP